MANVKMDVMIGIFIVFFSFLIVFINIPFLTFIVISYLFFKWVMLEKHKGDEKQTW